MAEIQESLIQALPDTRRELNAVQREVLSSALQTDSHPSSGRRRRASALPAVFCAGRAAVRQPDLGPRLAFGRETLRCVRQRDSRSAISPWREQDKCMNWHP